jgi:hypothetical protein
MPSKHNTARRYRSEARHRVRKRIVRRSLPRHVPALLLLLTPTFN